MTSSELDNREAPLCACGAPVCRDNLCAHCLDRRPVAGWDAFEAANRALPPDEQVD